MYIHHGCIGVYDTSLCCTCICVWFCNVYIVDVLYMSVYVYLMSMSILFMPFVCLLYSYKQSYNCVLPAAVSCGPAPDAPANGQQSGSGTTYGSTVTYTCNQGYTLQGDSKRTCLANGQWSGVTTNCSRKHICKQIDSSCFTKFGLALSVATKKLAIVAVYRYIPNYI